MYAFLRILLIVSCISALSACNEEIITPAPGGLEGTKFTIKSKDKEYYITIGKKIGNIVTSEATNWKNEFLYKNQYYRGLLLNSRAENGYHWELDIDFREIDALFPLEVGKTAEISGSIIDHKKETQYGYKTKISVIGEKPIILPSGTYATFKINISQFFDSPKGTKEWHQTVFHSPALSLNLRGIYTEGDFKEQWRVTNIKRPQDDDIPEPPARPRRRNGTVMI